MILYTIVKQSTGNVVLKDASTNLVLFVFVNVNALEVKSDTEVIVKFGFNQWKSLYAQQVKFTQIEPAAAIPFTGDAYDLADLLSGSFFFELSGGSQNLSQVLTVGNSAGSTDIDVNGNDLLNVNEITSAGDLFLNPVGSINCNGQTIDLTGGRLHNCDHIEGQNNNDIDIEAKGSGDIVLMTNNNTRLKITDTGLFLGLPEAIQLAASDETTALTTGAAKVTFRMPFKMTLTNVRASLTTAQTSGSIFTVDVNLNGTSLLSTKLTIDNTEKTSVTASTPAVISTSSLADDSEITVDIDQIGDGTAKGLKITLIGVRS
jgi:hypothetical protein